MTKQNIIEKLKSNSLRIHFTFADGNKTSVFCTLDMSKIPVNKQDSIGPSIEELIVAWDLEKLKWIAFKSEKVVSIDE
jgi:hypothetical protein